MLALLVVLVDVPAPKITPEQSCSLHDVHPGNRNSSHETFVPCSMAYYGHRRWNGKPDDPAGSSQVWTHIESSARWSLRLHDGHFEVRERLIFINRGE